MEATIFFVVVFTLFWLVAIGSWAVITFELFLCSRHLSSITPVWVCAGVVDGLLLAASTLLQFMNPGPGAHVDVSIGDPNRFFVVMLVVNFVMIFVAWSIWISKAKKVSEDAMAGAIVLGVIFALLWAIACGVQFTDPPLSPTVQRALDSLSGRIPDPPDKVLKAEKD
jgi:hypothetical protein